MSNIYSMTGFARAEGQVQGAGFSVEAKSVNHRYLDLKIHLPRELQAFEQKAAGLARTFFKRGRIDVWASLEPGKTPVRVQMNRPLAEGILAAVKEMKEQFNLEGEADLSLLASQKDVILINDSGSLGDDVWPGLERVFSECFHSLKIMRAQEGETLVKDVMARINVAADIQSKIEGKSGSLVAAYREKLEKRMNDLLTEEGGVDPGRLAQEAAIFADRSDITEELVRTRSHLEQFRSVLEAEGPKGRKLDFLVQEMFREMNTATSKASDAQVSGWAVDIKTELEKIREQVQNLE